MVCLVSAYLARTTILTVNISDSKSPNVLLLMFLFLPLNFLAATQDIAVDGWALTMLSR